ncbi:MAG TPA: DUF4349 domain-containing protein [Allosphingosinicella sp.]|nr:DUF4349 domain-containing protein [Allosphingosinicella sp.]
MSRSIPFLVLLLASTASCSRGPERSERSDSQGGQPSTQMEREPAARDSAAPVAALAPGAQEGRAAAGPNVSPTAAPGVAFNYRYAFALAAPRVAELQEKHAQMCERLTTARCRITGMHYQVLGPNDIEARLELKLDPGSARQFGRGAVDAVLQADGMLTENEISGIDVGTNIRQTGRTIEQLNADLQRIQTRLAARDILPEERERLEEEAQRVRDQIAAMRETREADQETLATTPMVFQYGSGSLVPGYRPPTSIGEALERAGNNFADGGKILLVALITIAPWLLALLLLLGIGLWVRRRWFPRRARPEAAPVEPMEA